MCMCTIQCLFFCILQSEIYVSSVSQWSTLSNTEHIFAEPHLNTEATPSIGELGFKNLKHSVTHQGMILWNRHSNYFQNWVQKDINIKMSSKFMRQLAYTSHAVFLFNSGVSHEMIDACFSEISWHWNTLLSYMTIKTMCMNESSTENRLLFSLHVLQSRIGVEDDECGRLYPPIMKKRDSHPAEDS